MTTLALKINENTPEGKAFLAMADVFIDNRKGVELAGRGSSVMQMIKEVITNIKNRTPKTRTLDEILIKERTIEPSFL